MLKPGNIYKSDDSSSLYKLVWDTHKDYEGYDCCFILSLKIHWNYADLDTNNVPRTMFAELESFSNTYEYYFTKYHSGKPAKWDDKQLNAVRELLNELHISVDYFNSIMSSHQTQDI